MTRPLHPLSESLLGDILSLNGLVDEPRLRDRLAAIEAAIRAEATPTEEAHEGPHDFRPTTCSLCGVRGFVNLSIVGEDERLDITKATPTDADLAR